MTNKYKKSRNSKYRQRNNKDANSHNYAKYIEQEFLTAILHYKKRYDNIIMDLNDRTRIHKKEIIMQVDIEKREIEHTLLHIRQQEVDRFQEILWIIYRKYDIWKIDNSRNTKRNKE